MKNQEPEANRQKGKEIKQRYQNPELKKHGKLKNKATQTILTYTYNVL